MAKKTEELYFVHTGAVASALDTVLGNAEFGSSGETSGDWIRRMIHKGFVYGVRDEERGWWNIHIEECFCLVVCRQLRDLGVPYEQIGELLEQLEFGMAKEVSVTRTKGSVTSTHKVHQGAAMKEAQWVLRVANAREHGLEFKRPKTFGSKPSVTTYSNATMH